MSDAAQNHGEPGLREKVEFLKEPRAYPSPPQKVEAVETHMSWVFLTDEYAWKLKKPVKNPYLDFTTIEMRNENCLIDVEQNQRLAPEVYLDAVPLTVRSDGQMELSGSGEVADWLVRMKRLPRDRSLESVIARGAVREEDLFGPGKLIADFYHEADALPMTAEEYRSRLRQSILENERQLSEDSYGLLKSDIERLTRDQLAFLDGQALLLDDRVENGRIIEAHGDLRPEHIWLQDLPVIIDCLEFNRDLRVLDPACELTFLALECERLNAAWVGDYFLSVYADTTGDQPVPELLDFYRRWNACTRAKLAAWHLKDHGRNDVEKWQGKANQYLRLAAKIRYAPPTPLGRGDAVIVVDVQKDFCPGGSLAVRSCRPMIGVLNRWIMAAEQGGAHIVASRDWHPPGHISFREQGGPWPAHCVQETEGAQFCDGLRLPPAVEVVSKGTDLNADCYSDFEGTGLADRLKRMGIRRVWIGGIALDVCVRATALDAVKAGFETHLIQDGTQAIDDASGRRTVDELQGAGVTVH